MVHLVVPKTAALYLLALALEGVAGGPKKSNSQSSSMDSRREGGGERAKFLPCVGAGKRANSHELNALGVTHQQSAKYEFAANCYKLALKKKPEFVVALFNMGTLRLAQGDDRGAITIFNEVLIIQPSYASAHYNMGSAYYRLGQERQAAASFKLAVGVDPNYVHAHANLATVLQMQGDLEGAKKHHQESIRIDPGFADGWMNLGNVLKALGQIEAALQSYMTATSLKPDFAMALYNLGVAHMSVGNHTASVEAYRRATTHNPTFANAYYNMGLSLQALGQFDSAVAAFSSATARESGFALSAYNNMGTVLDQLGRLPEAIQAYTTARNLIQEGDVAESSVLANLFNSLQAVCDWVGTSELEPRLMRLLEAVMRSDGEARLRVQPFHSLTYPFSANLALRIARFHARAHLSEDFSRPFYSLPSLLPSARNPRMLRVGYMVDSLNGTISLYLASLLASHDRHTVEPYVYLLKEDQDTHQGIIKSVR